MGQPGPGTIADEWRRGLRPVTRSRDSARRTYDRASRWYDIVEGPFERRPRRIGLRLLAPRPGERILDVGCGTGSALSVLGRAVGQCGRIVGVDLSPAMVARAAARVRRAGLDDRVAVRVADAASLPWPAAAFDALFASFTLELLDTPEIPLALAEWARVLRPGGRLVVVSLSRVDPVGWPVRVYEWLHDRFPSRLDCRPIHPALALEMGDFDVTQRIPVSLFGLPVEAVLGLRRPVAESDPATDGLDLASRRGIAADDRP